MNNAPKIDRADIQQAAATLDCDPAALLAVIQTESRGDGFLADGSVTILFERHVMRRRMIKHGIEPSDIGLAEHHWPDLVNRQPGGYLGGMAEHRRLNTARTIHEQSALESTSWGLFQIMGFHWQRLGFADVHTMVATLSLSEQSQLDLLVRFIQTDRGDLLSALQTHNWKAFAHGYNGPAYAKNQYDQKLAAAYKQARHIMRKDHD